MPSHRDFWSTLVICFCKPPTPPSQPHVGHIVFVLSVCNYNLCHSFCGANEAKRHKGIALPHRPFSHHSVCASVMFDFAGSTCILQNTCLTMSNRLHTLHAYSTNKDLSLDSKASALVTLTVTFMVKIAFLAP